MISLSVVIPVLNEASLIKELITRVENQIKNITSNYEVVVVDDGSNDLTWTKILQISANNSNITGIKLSRNFGQHYAISAGLAICETDYVIVMDGDLQDRPEVIPQLVNKAQEGFDVVFVNRENRPESRVYRFFQKLFYIILNLLSGLDLDSRQANFSIISAKVVKYFNQYSENTRFYASTIKWLGFSRTEIFADHGKRFSGKTSYTFTKRLRLALDIILSFSVRPLKFAIALGLIFSSVSMFLTINIIWTAIYQGYEVLGWASVITTITFFSGAILIVLGILGLYLGKVFTEVKNRPLYVIAEYTKNITKFDIK